MDNPKRCIVVDCAAIDAGKLNESLSKLTFRECLADAEESWGFYQYDELGESTELLKQVDRFVLFNLRRDRKKLNKTKLSRAWIAEINRQQDKAGEVFPKPKRKEIREQVKKELFKKTEPSESYYKGVFDSIKERLYVLVSEPTECEYVIDKLQRALEEQKVSISFNADALQQELEETLTAWLYDPIKAEDAGYTVGVNMMLSGEDSSSATLKHQEPDSSEVREHLGNRKSVQKLQLISEFEDGSATYTLTSTRILSHIDLGSICNPLCKAERENHKDVNALLDAEFVIWFQALSELWDKVKAIPNEI